MSTLRIMAASVAAACSLASSPVAAEIPDDYLFIEGTLVQHEERIPDRDLALGARFGFGRTVARRERSITGFEVGLFSNSIEHDLSDSDDQKGLILNLIHTFRLENLKPYVFGGLGMVQEDIGPVKEAFVSFEAGAGLWFDLSDKVLWRASLSAMSVRNDQLLSDQDAFVDLRLNVGLVWGIAGDQAPPRAAPAPARAVDSDGDGLADDQDRCPTTPASTVDGCPPAAPVVQTDSDGDGVYDAADECPGTLEGLKVDASGCAVQDAGGEKQSVVLKGVTFLPGSATLTEDAKGVLDGAAAAFNGQKDLKAEIGGHTDAQGSDAANQKLSQRRADSVRQYLLGKGVEAERLTAVGYGEAQPIATNDTPAGRAENRRVEFKLR